MDAVGGYEPAIVWPDGFDPDNLSRHASLNKTRLPAGDAPFGRFAGSTGADLLSRDAILRLVSERLDGGASPGEVTDVIARALAEPGTPQARAAAGVLDEVGERVAALVAAWRDPRAVELASPARRPYVRAWRQVEEVALGGGLAAGVVGARVAARATEALSRHGLAVPVGASPVAAWLPLLGAARSGTSTSGDSDVVVLDGGHTTIKRGVATVRRGALARLAVLPPVDPPRTPGAVARVVVEAVADARAIAGAPRSGDVTVSVAAYVRHGRPIADGASAYEALADSVAEVEAAIRGRLSIVHDGTAAWRGAATDRPSAVLVLGTWLGVGLGPGRTRPLRLSDDFTLVSA